ncbi:MAG: ecotin family protein [Granulosicoccaceae bacterium]
MSKVPAFASEEAIKNLEAYDRSAPGQLRHVIWLEPIDHAEESSHQVQLRLGVKAWVDGLNHAGLAIKLERGVVQGWGFPYYHFEGDAVVASTRMASKGELSEQWVWSPASLVDYNSRLPLVVYVPNNFGLSYRILAPLCDYRLVADAV